MPTSDGRRVLRVAELIRLHFADAVRRELDDPGLQTLVIASVKVTDDLSLVDIGIGFLGEHSESEQRSLMTRLRRALPRLRRALIPKLELRRAPSLRVHHDEGSEHARRVESLLKEIAEEPKGE